MTGLIEMTDKVLRKFGVLSAWDAQAQAKQAEMLVCFLGLGTHGAAGQPGPGPDLGPQPGKKAMSASERGPRRRRALSDLKLLVHSFPPVERRRVTAEIRAVFDGLRP